MIANGKGVTPASSMISSGLLILGSILLPIKNKSVIMSPQIQTQTDTQEKKKLILKLYIRLLLYINEKYNNKKTNDDTISKEELNSFLEYLQDLARPNKQQNKEDINSRALDETTLEAIIGQRVYSIDKSTQQKALKATKSMTKLMEDMLKEMSTTNDNKKAKYVNGKIDSLPPNDLKTLHKVLTEKRKYIESNTNTSEEINTIANIDGILTSINANYNIAEEEGEEY
jgi:hypothetical protein